ncbi:hypothetical protein MTR67_046564 [Solanum verrucosum]|uniref:Uncharacterized protein n=1 Tax=Solanum verrucosum TaxID=315347 RepID=A0AAF0ZY28_SOLVR|nr:hypothetical protein MTR67_046564 [Solanum verrucosum]
MEPSVSRLTSESTSSPKGNYFQEYPNVALVTSVSYLRNVVGIDTHLDKVKALLEMEINDVRIVGIWELLRNKDDYVNNKEDGKHMIAHRLRFKKVLVVLDDIDHNDHLDNLAGDLDWFGKGSRIIATTRDKHLIGKNDVVYEVTTLRDHQAIKLFNQYAFKEEVSSECFENLSLEVVNHAKGLPLALKVWGSFLHKRDIIEWRSAIEQMKINSKSEIVEKLKISYDCLETIQQDIFLDIACFLRGNEKDYIMSILASCYSGANIELSVLIDKSLVFIGNNKIQMHDLIQDMGKYIVKMQKDPGERSRLWDTTDLEEVMANNIMFFPSLRKLDLTGSISLMRTPDFMWMPNLEYLNLSGCTSLKEVHGSLGCSRKLIRLDLSHCKRLKRFPCVNLESLEYLFGKLKILVTLHLGDCSKLESLPEEIGDLENLEWLEARGTLISQPPSSIIRLNKLKILNFAKQETGGDLVDGVFFVLPHVNEGLHSLETLMLSYCNLIDGGLPEDIGCLSSLKNLYL